MNPHSVTRIIRTLHAILAPGALLIGTFLFWEFAVAWFDVPEFVLPQPSEIVISIWTSWPIYWKHLTFTLQNVLLGFWLAFVVAMVLGFLVAHFKIINRAVYPLLVASQTVPVIAIAPIFIIWFGYGILPKVIITALICFFPLTVNTVTGYMSVDEELKTLFRAYNAGRWQMFRKLTFPAALPYIMSGVKISATLSVIGGVIGEWIGSDRGLGYLIIQSAAQIMTTRVFGSIALLAVMGIGLFLIASIIDRQLMPWRHVARE